MTTDWRMPLWAALVLFAGQASASDAELQITLQASQVLQRNAHTGIRVVVQLPAANADAPLLLTPRIEGAAVELVRGRLLRSDGKRVDATHLRFEVPVVAKSEGTAILRVHVAMYACDTSCQRIEQVASAVLEVR